MEVCELCRTRIENGQIVLLAGKNVHSLCRDYAILKQGSKNDICGHCFEKIENDGDIVLFNGVAVHSRCLPQFRAGEKVKTEGFSVSSLKVSVKEKTLVSDVNLSFKAGTITAIMGPSGAGKSSLMDAICGRSAAQVSGEFFWNGWPCARTALSSLCGYVPQKDLFFPFLTVNETLFARARIYFPHEERAEIESRIQPILEDLDLVKVKDSRLQNLSGGQLKRVAIATTLIFTSTVLVLDEPTSGLDSQTSKELLICLKSLARKGACIIMSVHQPSNNFLDATDFAVLMINGMIGYSGPTLMLRKYFFDLQYVFPISESLSESILGVLKEDGEKLATVWRDRQSIMDFSGSNVQKLSEGNPLREIQVLFPREIKLFFRDRDILKAKVVQTIIIPLILGIMFLQLPATLTGGRDRIGAIFACFVYYAIPVGLFYAVSTSKRTTITKSEYQSRLFHAPIYYFCRLSFSFLIESVFACIASIIMYFLIGLRSSFQNWGIFTACLILNTLSYVAVGASLGFYFEDAELPTSLFQLLAVIYSFMAGFIVSSLPSWTLWLQSVDPLRYMLQVGAWNELDGLPLGNITGNVILLSYGLTDVSYGSNFGIGIGLTLGWVTIGLLLFLLKMKRR